VFTAATYDLMGRLQILDPDCKFPNHLRFVFVQGKEGEECPNYMMPNPYRRSGPLCGDLVSKLKIRVLEAMSIATKETLAGSVHA
jgi:hypothetical protein